MIAASLPANEERRLQALDSYEILDTDFELDYDELCQLAATICQVPIALISLIDRQRQWFKSSIGIEKREMDRDIAFCAHAILSDHILEVRDATQDVRFVDNPLVLGDPEIRFYAGQPLITDEGLAIGTLCTIDRVSRELTAEQRKALEILGRQVVARLELRRALLNLRRLNADKDRFFSIIGHDLRSPLSGIMNLIDLTVTRFDELSREERLSSLQLVSHSAHRLYNLSEDLLQWAKLEQGAMEFHPEILQVELILEEAVESLNQTAATKGILLNTDCEAGLTVKGDRQMLESAVRNLVSNAMKFSRKGSSVQIEASRGGSEIVVRVVDQGVGMDSEVLERLKLEWRASVRVGTEGESGSGLGLALVRQFARHHQGRLEISSEPDVGTTASLCLPAYDPATQAVDQQS